MATISYREVDPGGETVSWGRLAWALLILTSLFLLIPTLTSLKSEYRICRAVLDRENREISILYTNRNTWH